MKRALAAIAALAAVLFGCARHHRDDALVRSAARLRRSVVLVTAMLPGQTPAMPVREYATGTVVASGAWGSDIVTVGHAIEGAHAVHVTIFDRRKVAARVIGRNRALDVALLRIATRGLPAARLGRTAQAQPGRLVGLVGYPIPDQFHDQGFRLTGSVAAGRIAARLRDALELMLPIVPGESGAPVFLADNARVVGMAESRFSSEHSIGFALPVDDLRDFLHRYDSAHGL